LDLYLPQEHGPFPVVVLVHGGAWVWGSKTCLGLMPPVARCLASQGIGVVVPNYHLSPWSKHPEHIRDVARAFAWTHKNISRFGGNPDQLFLAGHSAGGHLVSLLATDESYLQAEGLHTGSIKGVISLAGVYRIPAGRQQVTFGGQGSNAFWVTDVLPFRHNLTMLRKTMFWMPGVPLSLNFFRPSFGNDPYLRFQASPLNHVRPGLPPFLLFTADYDYPFLPVWAREFNQALRDNEGESELLCIPDSNHNSLIFSATSPEDPVIRTTVEFIRRHVSLGPQGATRP
jgi:acetyl esterase/lipase